MSINEARTLLGEQLKDMNDEQVQEFIIQCQRFASIIVDFAEKRASN